MTKFGLELKKIMKFENLRTFFRPLRSISGPLEALDPLGPRKWVKVLKVFFQKQLRKWKSDQNWLQESSREVSYPIQKVEIFSASRPTAVAIGDLFRPLRGLGSVRPKEMSQSFESFLSETVEKMKIGWKLGPGELGQG